MNDEQFVERLGKVSVREIIRTAKDRHNGTQGFAEAMLLQYNKRLKYPLKWTYLQGTQNPAADENDPLAGKSMCDSSPEAKIQFEEPDEDTEDDDEREFDIPDNAGALPAHVLMDNLTFS